MAVTHPNGWHNGVGSRWALFDNGRLVGLTEKHGEAWRWSVAFDFADRHGEADGWENALRDASKARREALTIGASYNHEVALLLGRVWSGQVIPEAALASAPTRPASSGGRPPATA